MHIIETENAHTVIFLNSSEANRLRLDLNDLDPARMEDTTKLLRDKLNKLNENLIKGKI